MQMSKIILIMTDTQRADMLGCYQETGLKTPFLDTLASESMRFTKAYNTQPVCGPARSAIFTGLFPHSNGITTNSVSLYGNVKTIGQRLKDYGYHTAYIGKWHLDGGDYFGLGTCPEGWDPDYWYDMKNYLEELPNDERLRSRKEQTMLEEPISSDFTFGHRVSNKAIDFLEKHTTEDYLLVISYDEPHHPSLCPEPYASMYKDYTFPVTPNIFDYLDGKPEYQKQWAGKKLNENPSDMEIKSQFFFGCNTYIDSEIGRVLRTIKDYADDALIIYTSDHGDFLESHHLTGKGPAAYDEITKIPLLIKCKGIVEGNTIYKYPVSHIDLVPTIMDFAGLKIPQWIDGQSLLQGLKNHTIRVNDCIFIEFERYEIDHDGFGGYQPLRGVYDGRFKLVLNLLCSDELYDLEEDPYEINNLIDNTAYFDIRSQLHNRLLRWQNDTRDPLRGYYWANRSWCRESVYDPWNHTGMTRQREHEEYETRQLDYDTGLPMKKAVRPK